MGESSAWRRHSFSQPSSPTSSAEKQGNSLKRALTSSVSFGRFMSEQLDWEKWSTFTHNRYLEDVEKYSRPGSVAEKKAFFEAHYRRRNAALVEQQNAMTSNFTESNITNVVIEETKADAVRNRELVSSIVANGCIATVDEKKLDDASTGGAEKATEPPVLTENLVATTTRDSELSDKKKSAFSTTKLSTIGIASKLVSPAKPETPVQLRKNDRTTLNRNTALNSISKENLTATSLHMSVNFASCAGETKKASVDGILKRRSVSPQPEMRRTITKHDKSISENRTVTSTMQSPNLSYNISSSTWGSEARCSTVSSSSSFKSDVRVAKIKEFFQNLEPKLNMKEAGKKQLHSKLQMKAAGDNKDSCHSISLNATPNAKIFHKTESPSNLKKKIPTVVKPRSPIVHSIESRPPWRLSTKIGDSKNVTGKNSLPQVNASKLFTKKSMHENTSPNIQQ